jgi:DNA primase
MAGRICIPIHDAAGALVAYAGRWPGEPPEGVERYLLPKQFQKSRVLFNLHRLNDAEHLVLVEGYWSTFRLHAMGVPVAALMGSSVSEEQLALLRERGTRRLTLLWDGDDAGRKARERWLPVIANTFFVRAPHLPDGEKPDTLDEAELRELVSIS